MRIQIARLSPATWIVLAFLLSRLSYYAAGIEFDARPLQFYVQFLDPELLRARLLESLFYLHTQPPGFNLFLGIVLKLFPSSYDAAFQVLYFAMGLGIGQMLYRLMHRLGVRRRIACGLTVLFTVSPAAILYETHLTYEYPILFLMCAAALSLVEWTRARRPWLLAAFQGSLLALVLIRGTYQPIYYLAICAALAFAFRGHRRTIALSAALPLALILALCGKNWILFGAFGTGSWPGFQAAIMTTYQLSDAHRESMQKRGLLSPLASVPPIMPLSDYEPHVKRHTPRGIPALDEAVKSTGAVNPNHLSFLEVQKIHLADARATVREHPRALAKSLSTAWFTYFLPATDFPFFDHNRPRIAALDRAFNVVFHGQMLDASDRKKVRQAPWWQLPFYTGTFLLLGLPALWIWALWRLVTGFRNGDIWLSRAFPIAFLLFNIAFVTAVSNLASCFENNRYRFSLDAFHFVLIGLLLTWIADRRGFALSRVATRPQAEATVLPQPMSTH